MKIRPMGVELLHANRHDEANSPFLQFLRKRLRTDWITLSWLSAADSSRNYRGP